MVEHRLGRHVAGALLVVLVACHDKGKGNDKAPPPKPPADASIEVDWAGCGAALKKAATFAPTRRAQLLLDACQPCGDWAPLLHWNVLPGEGGPARLAIEGKMLACGYCEPNATQRFLGLLDNARGTDSRAPWRVLGEVCGARVSAMPDARFMSAPYYALDRIARAAAARPELAPLLAAIEIPLPAISVTGSGFALPTAAVSSPIAGPAAITVTPAELWLGAVPRAKLGPDGLAVIASGEPYPGALLPPAKLGAALAAVTGPIAVIAPSGSPAKRIVELVELVGDHELELAVVGPGSPEGWIVPGTVPVMLSRYIALDQPRTLAIGDSADPAIAELKAHPVSGTIAIALAPTTTVATLAKLLGALAFQGARAAMLTTAP